MESAISIPAHLHGDGEQDDTAAIQQTLDSGVSAIYLPPPARHYLISKPLLLHSNQALLLDRFTTIRLAPHSDCPMLANANQVQGNENVAVSGGIWDMNNIAQAPNPIATKGDALAGQCYDPDRYLGVLMRFVCVRNLTIRSLTFRDPITFSVQLARVSHFTVDDITFDFQHWNPVPGNMDGIHLDGHCRFGSITNLKGATYDDLIALNADDGDWESPCFGPIEDIAIAGIYASDCHSAIRLLSNGSWVRRISIANVFGSYYQYVIGITNAFPERGTGGNFDQITLRGIFASKAVRHSLYRKDRHPIFPIIWCEKGTHVGTLTIQDLHRCEENVATECVAIARGASVEHLCIENASYVNHTDQMVAFLGNEGQIGTLVLRGIVVPGERLLDNGGYIATLDSNSEIVHNVHSDPPTSRPRWTY